jgi:hypothetical protein
VRRHILGLITLAAFAFAATVICFPAFAAYAVWGAMSLRVGTILGVAWLAWPDIVRLPRWAWCAVPAGFFLLYFARGYLVFFLIPAIVVAMILYVLFRKVWRSPSR